MVKCEICQKEFDKLESIFVHTAVSYGREKKRGEKLFHIPLGAYRAVYLGEKEFSKERIKMMYWIEKKSSQDIANILKTTKMTLLSLMEYYGIKRRNKSQSEKNKVEMKGLWNKGLTKYDHPSIMKSAQDRIGKNNPYYTAPFFEKRKKNFAEARKKGWAKYNANRNPKTTERRIAKILDDNKIFYTRNFSLNYIDSGKKRWSLYDFLINGILMIETQGDYWHLNPKKYAKDYLNLKGISAEEVWEKDEKKKKLSISKGYKFLCLWEDDIKSMTDIELYNLIMKAL